MLFIFKKKTKKSLFFIIFNIKTNICNKFMWYKMIISAVEIKILNESLSYI